MRVLSLFSGGGLGDYGLELAGMEIVGQVEIDDYCQKILKLRWPDVPKWKDIRDVTRDEIISKCGEIDLIAGGFPCTDISTSKNNAEGLSGTRSGLWFEQLRLICDLRPKFALIENVAGLLVRGLDTVLYGLTEGGYDAEWQMLSSLRFGAYHLRNRLFVVAYPSGGRLQRVFPGFETFESSVPKPSTQMANDRFDELVYLDGRIWPSPSRVRRVASKIANRVDRLKLLGNGQDPKVVEWIGKRIMEFELTASKPGEVGKK